ncbi:MAG: LysR family transcriptional regulator [Marinosulfonomonas sp.]
MIDTKVAAAVRALVQYRNFRAAADALATSPASFSRYIAQAETFAGHALFERHAKGASLTPAGREFLSMLDAFMEATSRFQTGVQRLRNSGPDILNIGCGPLTTRTIIAPILAQMLADQPDLRALVQVRATKEPLEELRNGRLDVAVCDLTHTPDLSDLDLQVLKKEPVSFWARLSHPLHRKTNVSVADVFRDRFITAHLHRHWRTAIASVLGGTEEAWQITNALPQVECDDFAFMTELACRVDLVCGGMREDFRQYADLGLLKEIGTTETLTWNICAARRKDTGFPALDIFWSQLFAQFGAP